MGTTLPETNRFNGRALWKLLKEKYAGSDLVSCSAALDHFLDLKYQDVASFCSAIRLSNQRLVLANVLKGDQVKIMIMLCKLPRGQYQLFRDIIAMGFATKTFESAIKQLKSYALSNNIKKELMSKTQATMMTTASTSKPTVLCLHCGKTGHRPHNCWVKHPEKAPKTKAAHLTIQENYPQLSDKSSSDADGYFTYLQTPDGNCNHLNDCKWENVKYF
ncbi:hypothetical protein PCASD_07463 [Puccinia coronata f. sp. avenae]|uniref:CCHC-type domain-containing protein n=1 Tax=Puccinia coronata f. sp. avenae TaxID=200324 RepID=A0A2N5TG83_9BASI|nr:hypothetical protein PCASD_07463 [Puccinia coronata f. sp. avenae]